MLGPHFHSWLSGALDGKEQGYKPKEDLGDAIFFSAVIVCLVLVAVFLLRRVRFSIRRL